MDLSHLNEVVADFSADEIDTKGIALEKALAAVQYIAQAAVASLQNYPIPIPLPVMERLFAFGSIIAEPLAALFESSHDDEIKTLAALGLLRFGHLTGVQWLLRMLREESEDACIIARDLGRAKIIEAKDVIIGRLRSYTLQDDWLIICMLNSLQELGESVPSDVNDNLATLAINKLAKLDPEEFSQIAKLVEILDYLGRGLPPEVRERLSSNPSAQRLIDKFFGQ